MAAALLLILGMMMIMVMKTEGCMLPKPAPPVLSLSDAVIQAPIAVYGQVVHTHTLGEPVEPVQFQVYCSYNLDRPLDRTNIIEFKGDFLGNSCSFTEMMVRQDYIVLLQPCPHHSGMLEIFKANAITSASYEATMHNLNILANSLCQEGDTVAGSPPYLACPQPRDDCTPPELPVFTTQNPELDDDADEEEDVEGDGGAQAEEGEASAVHGKASSTQGPHCYLVVFVLMMLACFTKLF